MPQYSSEPWNFPGSEPEYAVVITDGAGATVDWCVFVDTDTGEVVRQERDAAGNPVVAGEDVRCVREFRPLPITLTRQDDADTPVVVDACPQ